MCVCLCVFLNADEQMPWSTCRGQRMTSSVCLHLPSGLKQDLFGIFYCICQSIWPIGFWGFSYLFFGNTSMAGVYFITQFYQVLKIWTQVFMLTQQVFCLLNHLPHPQSFYFYLYTSYIYIFLTNNIYSSNKMITWPQYYFERYIVRLFVWKQHIYLKKLRQKDKKATKAYYFL